MGNEFSELDAKNTVAVALLLDSPVLVGVLTAIQWFLRTKSPLKSFAAPADALAWIGALLQRESLAVPAGAADALAALDEKVTP